MAGLANLPSSPAEQNLAPRHQQSELNSAFHGEGLSYTDYIALTQTMLRKAHLKLGTTNIETVVAGNSPFQRIPNIADGTIKPYKRGILLTHGLSDSPYFMRALADFFQAQNFFVLAILLPGHGTQAGDLLDVTWQEWAKAVAFGVNSLEQKVDEIYLGGLSTGATLSIHQSLNDERVRGLFLYAPALKITPRAALARLHKLYSWLIPSAKWVSIQPDGDDYKYESFAMNGAAQMYALTRGVQTHLTSLRIPIFIAASADDVTVQTPATLQWFAKIPTRYKQMLLFSTTIVPNNASEKIDVINSAFPELGILSSSHLALVLPATDPHYGAQGSYANCTHYFPQDMEKYCECKSNSSEVLQGEITAKNLEQGIVKRLMFNPNFTQMTAAMQKFIDNLPAQKTFLRGEQHDE